MTGSDEIVFDRRGGLVVVTLNRPRALNSLSLDMCRALAEGLKRWQADPGVGAVLIKGEGERAFCAGGDIRRIYDLVTAGQITEAAAFYAVEYPMNARLYGFTKPWIALLDGVTMGGGVGVSVHGSHRVVTERTVFAMPETGIGFFPDVGGTHWLPRVPGALGMYLGLTGARLGAADCLAATAGTHFVPADRLEALEAALADADVAAGGHAAVDEVLRDFQGDPGASELADLRPRIDACFGAATLDGVVEALEGEPDGWGATQLEVLNGKSPTSLAVTFAQIRAGAGLDFAQAMRLEYRLVHRFLEGHDFREGVRALIVDKDNRPRWRPATLAEIGPADVDAWFAPLPGGELRLSGAETNP